MSLYTAENPVFASFSFYAAVLGIKTLMMAFLTGRQRLAKGVSEIILPYYLKLLLFIIIILQAFANAEDTILDAKKGKIKTDEDVERVRRYEITI